MEKSRYPITDKTLCEIADKISKPVKKKSCVSVVFEHEFGGASTIIRILLDEKDRFQFFADPNFKTCYIEATDLLEPSLLSFFYKILSACSKSAAEKFAYEDISLNELIKILKKEIQKICTKKTLVIFFTRLQNYHEFNKKYGNLLYLLRDSVSVKSKLFYVFTFYDMLEETFDDFLKRQDLLKSSLTDSVVRINPLGKNDILHSIEFWEKYWGYQLF